MDALGLDASLYERVPKSLRRLVFERIRPEHGGMAPAFSEPAAAAALPYIAPFYRYYFRCQVRGFEKVPQAPAFIVANHNALGVAEVPLFFYAWRKHFGPARPLHGLAHRMIFTLPPLRSVLPRFGVIPAAPEVACKTLAAGRDLLVFPGGDWEAGRPFYERKRIDFDGRTGFIRVALETGAPLVPLAICGAHETQIIFARGDGLSRALGLDEWLRLKTLPLTPQTIYAFYKTFQALRGRASPLFLPLWIANAWVGLPLLPSKIVMEFLEPLDLRKELRGVKGEEHRLQAGYRLVTRALQRKMDELQAERRTFLG